jgi:DNA segregation ATPase FtsK/SpoIIIE, S-DNA-T family
MFTSAAIGAIPRMGKTFALRELLLIAGLDPRTELHCYDLKGTGDLSPLACLAHRYRAGDDEQDIDYALADMRALRAELRRRAKVIRELPRHLCPETRSPPNSPATTGTACTR